MPSSLCRLPSPPRDGLGGGRERQRKQRQGCGIIHQGGGATGRLVFRDALEGFLMVAELGEENCAAGSL